MGHAIAVFAVSAAQHLPRPALPTAFIAFWREMLRPLFDGYRPERHYMRGPGPAWRKKHGEPE